MRIFSHVETDFYIYLSQSEKIYDGYIGISTFYFGIDFAILFCR